MYVGIGYADVPKLFFDAEFFSWLALESDEKAETARRVRGRINAILDAESVMGH
jgi:hypothetical protein